MVLAVTPVPQHSSAITSASVATPSFATAYAHWPLRPSLAVRLDTMTRRPQPPSSISGSTACEHRNAEVRFRSVTRLHVSNDWSWTGSPPCQAPTRCNQHLDGTELAVKLGQRGAERVLIGDVGFDDGQVGAQIAERGPELRDLRLVAARDRHPMTILEQPARHGASQRAGPSGYKDPSTHASTPRSKMYDPAPGTDCTATRFAQALRTSNHT